MLIRLLEAMVVGGSIELMDVRNWRKRWDCMLNISRY
jgi:hypothetical protein